MIRHRQGLLRQRQPQQRLRRHFLRSRDVPMASRVRQQVRRTDTTTGPSTTIAFAILVCGTVKIYCFENPQVDVMTATEWTGKTDRRHPRLRLRSPRHVPRRPARRYRPRHPAMGGMQLAPRRRRRSMPTASTSRRGCTLHRLGTTPGGLERARWTSHSGGTWTAGRCRRLGGQRSVPGVQRHRHCQIHDHRCRWTQTPMLNGSLLFDFGSAPPSPHL